MDITKEYDAKQADWIKENNIVVGTEVRVTGTAETRQDGWQNSWIDSDMTNAVGKIGKVTDIDGLGNGIDIEFEDIDIDDAFFICNGYSYPYFVLEVM